MPSCEVLIVTYRRDFPYLAYCLRSIKKFASGFNGVRILVPHEDVEESWRLVDAAELRAFPAIVTGYQEKEGKGFLWHMRQIMYADTWCEAEMVAHIDGDCVFDSPITPDYFLETDGKIILRYEPFTSICKRHDAMARWQDCTQKILPFPVKHETMRGHPEVYHRSTYPLARDLIERKTNIRIDEYILSCENAFPQTFCEHVTLGNVAMEKQPEKYHPVLQTSDKPTPHNKVFQAWSHGSIDQPQDLWYKGKQSSYVPVKEFQRILSSYVPTQEETARMHE